MTRPVRIQLRRAKGFKMPPNTVCVARPGRWGNPVTVNPNIKAGTRYGAKYICVATATDAVECFRRSLNERPDIKAAAIAGLRGKNLACWCPLDQPCHADVLLELANAPLVDNRKAHLS